MQRTCLIKDTYCGGYTSSLRTVLVCTFWRVITDLSCARVCPSDISFYVRAISLLSMLEGSTLFYNASVHLSGPWLSGLRPSCKWIQNANLQNTQYYRTLVRVAASLTHLVQIRRNSCTYDSHSCIFACFVQVRVADTKRNKSYTLFATNSYVCSVVAKWVCVDIKAYVYGMCACTSVKVFTDSCLNLYSPLCMEIFRGDLIVVTSVQTRLTYNSLLWSCRKCIYCIQLFYFLSWS